MKNQTPKKSFLFFYHLLILVLSWYFTIRYEANLAYTLNITDLGITGLMSELLPKSPVIMQTIIFLAATLDAFTTLNLWWSKRYSNLKTASGEFFAWFSTLKSGQKKQEVYAVWQAKLYAIFLMVNTFFLALIFALIFYSTEFEPVYFLTVGLVSISILALFISIRLFLRWMEKPLLDNGKVIFD